MYCRLIVFIYINRKICVKWDDYHSQFFQGRNGVKQGGILSPFLFTIYTDTLLDELRKSGLGCHIGLTFVGAIAYADDIIILAPTKFSLKTLLRIASDYAKILHIQFNPDKCQLLFFTPNEKECVFFEGTLIKEQMNATHLGNLIGQGCADKLS